MQRTKIAVTGAAGFLGAHIARGMVARGFDVLPIVRAATGGALEPEARGPELLQPLSMSDVLDRPEALRGVQTLVHAAAVRHRHGVDARSYRESNVTLVERLLRAAHGRVSRFVYISSVGVYGFPERLPIDERFPFAPKTLYSVTKIDAERLVRRLSPQLGIEFSIVRPTIVYGPGDANGMLDKTARMIRSGTYRLVGNGTNTLHHTHVDDVVLGIYLAATAPAAAGEDFILAGPETTTLGEFSRRVAASLGARLPRLPVPLSTARAIATLVDVAAYRRLMFTEREPPINNEKLDVMTRSIAFDTAKARACLGYVPRVGYFDGIARTLATVGGRKCQS